jgi:hypothetical protein
MQIKAIETKYKGYRFRSRLEARWAVFFDKVGIKWEYEPEGFQLSNGLYYLPDFKIKYPGDEDGDHWAWIEIKSERLNQLEHKKLQALFEDSGRFTYALIGIPGDHEVGRTTRKNPIEYYSYCKEPQYTNLVLYRWLKIPVIDSIGIVCAIEEAKSARFEFGEAP